MTNFNPLKKPLLSREVELAIKKAIADGTYHPGSKLPSEREFVDFFQVSRVTVREALHRLQSTGLLKIKRGINAGAYVSEPNPDAITENFQNLIQMGYANYSHLIDARLYIEPRAAEMAAKYRTAEDLQRLQNLLDLAESLISNSRKRARLINVSFHSEVAKITGNPIIVFITESITQSYSEIIIEKTQMLLSKKHIQKFINEHRNILDSIIMQNSTEAYEKTRRHLVETYITYSKVFPEAHETGIDRRIKQEYNF